MAATTRREFFGSMAAVSLATHVASTRAEGPVPKTVHLAVIGCGGRGTGVGSEFAQIPGVEMVAVCDPDQERLAGAQKKMKADVALADLREVLAIDKIDAVIIATPDHWHTPAALLALAAGKHVYVEKPCSHNIREGRLLVDAARKHNRLVQHGTQSRSCDAFITAAKDLRAGIIGDVLAGKVINSQKRANIGHASPSTPPSTLNYELWQGPAPPFDYQPNLIPYNWHWFHHFGTGDIGNDGVHQLDVARWGLGVDRHPDRAAGWGTKLFFDDDQQFPDTYQITFEYQGAGPGGKPLALIYEQRIWTDYSTEGVENGNIFYGTDGKMILGNGRVLVLGKRDKVIKEEKYSRGDRPHFENFLEAVRGNGSLNAEIEIGHHASTLAHLGNIVAGTGANILFDPKTETITNHPDAQKLVTRDYRDGHWAVPKA